MATNIIAHMDPSIMAANVLFYMVILPGAGYVLYKVVQTVVSDFRNKEGLFAKEEEDWL